GRYAMSWTPSWMRRCALDSMRPSVRGVRVRLAGEEHRYESPFSCFAGGTPRSAACPYRVSAWTSGRVAGGWSNTRHGAAARRVDPGHADEHDRAVCGICGGTP